METSRVLTIVALPLVLAVALRADPPEDGKARAEEFLAFARREAASHTMRQESDGRALTLRPEPVLKWSNPLVGEIYGNDFVWTSKGRPEVVWSLHRWYRDGPHEAVEYLSLSTDRVVAEKDGQVIWHPSRPGIEMNPIPNAAPPGASAAQRLRQMRELAKEFTSRQTRRDGVEQENRLLTQPTYRYEGTEPPLIDGALFAFVQGTDPELFLLIEARQVDGKTQWQYGLARMTSLEQRVRYRGKPVWTAPGVSYAEVAGPAGPYMSFVLR
jgi:hypothetical protein